MRLTRLARLSSEAVISYSGAQPSAASKIGQPGPPDPRSTFTRRKKPLICTVKVFKINFANLSRLTSKHRGMGLERNEKVDWVLIVIVYMNFH